MGFAQRDRAGVAAPVAAKRRMGLRVRAVWALGTSRCRGSVFSFLPFLRGEMSRAALPGCIFFFFRWHSLFDCGCFEKRRQWESLFKQKRARKTNAPAAV